MTVTSGFFDSMGGDRKYNALQMAQIFDGIITDGVIANYGNKFTVTPGTASGTVNVGTGRAWFDHTWTLNDAILVLTLPQSELLLNRYDAVILEVNHTGSVRQNSIYIVSGIATASSDPSYPTLQNDDTVKQYPLAYIYRKANTSAVTESDIRIMVGTDATPYCTAPLESISIDEHFNRWSAQWDDWFNQQQQQASTDIQAWESSVQGQFMAWWDELDTMLDGDIAANLTQEIVRMRTSWNNLTSTSSIRDAVRPLENENDSLMDNNGNNIEGVIFFEIR